MCASLKRAILPFGTTVLRLGLGVTSTGAVNSFALNKPRPSVSCGTSFRILLDDGLRAPSGDLKRKRKPASGDAMLWSSNLLPGVALVGVSCPALRPMGLGGAVWAPRAWKPSQRASSRILAVLAWWCAGCISTPAGFIGVRLLGVRAFVAEDGCGSCDVFFEAPAGFCGVFMAGSSTSGSAGSGFSWAEEGFSWAGDCSRDGAVSQLRRELSGVGERCCRRSVLACKQTSDGTGRLHTFCSRAERRAILSMTTRKR